MVVNLPKSQTRHFVSLWLLAKESKLTKASGDNADKKSCFETGYRSSTQRKKFPMFCQSSIITHDVFFNASNEGKTGCVHFAALSSLSDQSIHNNHCITAYHKPTKQERRPSSVSYNSNTIFLYFMVTTTAAAPALAFHFQAAHHYRIRRSPLPSPS
jgi:hypothetical protein